MTIGLWTLITVLLKGDKPPAVATDTFIPHRQHLTIYLTQISQITRNGLHRKEFSQLASGVKSAMTMTLTMTITFPLADNTESICVTDILCQLMKRIKQMGKSLRARCLRGEINDDDDVNDNFFN